MKSTTANQLLKHAEQLCNQRGVRFTAQRKKVFKLICSSNKPVSAYNILEQMPTKSSGAPAPPTVYRALEFLLNQGLVHKLESLHAFVGCTHPQTNHHSHFLICIDCGDTKEVEDTSIAKSVQSAKKDLGFRINKSVVELIGKCHDCYRKTRSSTG